MSVKYNIFLFTHACKILNIMPDLFVIVIFYPQFVLKYSADEIFMICICLGTQSGALRYNWSWFTLLWSGIKPIIPEQTSTVCFYQLDHTFMVLVCWCPSLNYFHTSYQQPREINSSGQPSKIEILLQTSVFTDVKTFQLIQGPCPSRKRCEDMWTKDRHNKI